MLCSGLKLGRHVPPLGEGQSNLLCGRHHHECCLNTINHGDLPAKFWFIWWDEHPFTSSFDVTQGTGFWPTPISIQQSRDTPNLLFKCEKKTNFLFFAGSTLFTNKPIFSICGLWSWTGPYTLQKSICICILLPQRSAPTPNTCLSVPYLPTPCTQFCMSDRYMPRSKVGFYIQINQSFRGIIYIYVPILFGFPLRNGWPWTMFWPWHIDVTICSSLIPCVRCSCVYFY